MHTSLKATDWKPSWSGGMMLPATRTSLRPLALLYWLETETNEDDEVDACGSIESLVVMLLLRYYSGRPTLGRARLVPLLEPAEICRDLAISASAAVPQRRRSPAT